MSLWAVRPRAATAVVGIGGMAVVALAAIGQHVRYTELGYRAVRLESRRLTLVAEIKRSEAEREGLRDPGRLAEIAAERHFEIPAAGQVRTIEVPAAGAVVTFGEGEPARGWAARLLEILAGA